MARTRRTRKFYIQWCCQCHQRPGGLAVLKDPNAPWPDSLTDLVYRG
ncbi:MAG: hypothetical protein R2822_16980 [Spirosomataceae bacterium]